jgi:hypothetical protein
MEELASIDGTCAKNNRRMKRPKMLCLQETTIQDRVNKQRMQRKRKVLKKKKTQRQKRKHES